MGDFLYRYEYNSKYPNNIEVFNLKKYETNLNKKNALEVFDNVINDYTLERFARFCNNNRIQTDAYFTLDPLKMIFLQGFLINIAKDKKLFKEYIHSYIDILYPFDTYKNMVKIYNIVWDLYQDTDEIRFNIEQEILRPLGILDVDHQYSYLLS